MSQWTFLFVISEVIFCPEILVLLRGRGWAVLFLRQWRNLGVPLRAHTGLS